MNIVANPQDLSQRFLSWNSASFVERCRQNALRGLIISAGTHLASSGLDKAQVAARVLEFLGVARAAGDLTKSEAEYYEKYNYYEPKAEKDIWYSYIPMGVRSCYSYFWSIFEDVLWCYTGAAYNKKEMENFNLKEQKLINELRVAETAYYQAREKFYKHFSLLAIRSIKEVVTSYATVLSKLDGAWFESLSKAIDRSYESALKEAARSNVAGEETVK